MTKKDKKILKKVKERLDNCIDLYIDLFCKKQDVYFDGWVSDQKGGLAQFGDSFFGFDDIRLDLERDVKKGVIFDWHCDNMDCEIGGIINYNSYVTGLRVSDLEKLTKP